MAGTRVTYASPRVLLVWNEIPEITRFFAIDNPGDADLEVLSKANGHYINSSTEEDEAAEPELNKVNAAVSHSGEGFDGEALTWLSKWTAGEIKEADLPKAGTFHQVFSCGFLL